MTLQIYVNFDLEGHSSSRASCWLFVMRCGFNFVITEKGHTD